MSKTEITTVPPKRGRGRPRKDDPYIKPKKVPKVMGRPKELGTRVQELKERLLMSPEAAHLVSKVISKAMDDNDKDQMVAMKLCLDRILPVSTFEKAKNEGAKIQVNISTANFDAPIDSAAKSVSFDFVDAEVVKEDGES